MWATKHLKVVARKSCWARTRQPNRLYVFQDKESRSFGKKKLLMEVVFVPTVNDDMTF